MTNRIFYHKSTGQPVQIIVGAQTKPTYQQVICYQELVEPYEHYVMEKKQFFAEYVRRFEDLPLVGRKQIEKREDLPDKQPRISKGEIETPENETEENESEKGESEKEQVVSKDPRIQKLIEFFDANTNRKKMKLLEQMKDELDEFMLNNIAVSLDLSIEDGMDGYERIMSELKIRSKYESERGERF